jgi:hypothetical protein
MGRVWGLKYRAAVIKAVAALVGLQLGIPSKWPVFAHFGGHNIGLVLPGIG